MSEKRFFKCEEMKAMISKESCDGNFEALTKKRGSHNVSMISCNKCSQRAKVENNTQTFLSMEQAFPELFTVKSNSSDENTHKPPAHTSLLKEKTESSTHKRPAKKKSENKKSALRESQDSQGKLANAETTKKLAFNDGMLEIARFSSKTPIVIGQSRMNNSGFLLSIATGGIEDRGTISISFGEKFVNLYGNHYFSIHRKDNTLILTMSKNKSHGNTGRKKRKDVDRYYALVHVSKETKAILRKIIGEEDRNKKVILFHSC
ncbi:MAG: hypothetical protein IBX55_00220 [Methyloprofundus sp.]|nr:hypothetical protein [Methyloprofundus sp.]